jgi:signal peptidase I
MRRVLTDVILPLAVAAALAFVVQAALAKPYEIPTGSMEPTIQPHDRVVANRVIYRFRDIARGDIIVFHPTESAVRECAAPPGEPFVKRVIGLPGDRVEVHDGVTLVNGEPYVVDNARTPHYAKTWPPVPAGELLVLGDNRDNSCDAHQWAPDPFLPQDAVIGQAEVTYWPPTRLGFLD